MEGLIPSCLPYAGRLGLESMYTGLKCFSATVLAVVVPKMASVVSAAEGPTSTLRRSSRDTSTGFPDRAVS